MINATKNMPVFIETGEQLSASIIGALKLASEWILKAYQLEKINLLEVNTKTFNEAILPALVENFICIGIYSSLNENYVRDVYDLISSDRGDCAPELYNRLTMGKTFGKWNYRKSYLPALRRGFAVFLVALHVRRAIVLPFSFKWPIGLEKDELRRVVRRREVCPINELPELLRFFRSLESQAENQTEDVFNQYGLKQRERLASIGQRLVVAAGWLEPKDANYDDLLALFEANEKEPLSKTPNLGCLMLVDLLERKYPSITPVTAAGWRKFLSNSRLRPREIVFTESIEQNEDVLMRSISIKPSQMAPAVLAQGIRLPGLDFDISRKGKVWLALENSWLKKVKRESNKDRVEALGYINIYLFGYLPYWFEINPNCKYEYPDTPKNLVGSVFVSDLGLLSDKVKPVTFVDYLQAVAKDREWGNQTHYAILKQVEKFFNYVVIACAQTPDYVGFSQPLSDHDFPAVGRSYGTNKRPIPRRIFKLFLDYIEVIAIHGQMLFNRIVSGEVSDTELGKFRQSKSTVIDTFEFQDLFGFIPAICNKEKFILLRYIPNILFVNRKLLVDGRRIQIPHLHAINQIKVSLCTGIRHNHIQWLDAETFDKENDVNDDNCDFGKLHVNTDKVKTKPWDAHVNIQVIETLRAQLAWRKMIAEPGFKTKIFYNNNSNSKWGKFHPLFSYYPDGKPHNDNIYAKAWLRLLGGLQSMLSECGESSISLVRFLPNSVPFNCFDQAEQLFEFGSSQKRRCELVLKSDITPHSARVSVVSHSISILPPELIGRYLTGQKEATVLHYVVPDEDEIYEEQVRQGLILRQRGYERGFQALVSELPSLQTSFIKADDVNSSLSQSLKIDVEETISAHGCISLSINGNQNKTGLDILRETRAFGAAVNTTEICPYGNQCPTDVVVALKGFRRCGPCHFAVRSVDHLPAITAKIRQVLEGLAEIEARLDTSDEVQLSANEWDLMADNRSILAEDLAAWQMAAEILEIMRQRVASGDSTKTWHIQRPEIIERHLKLSSFPSKTTEYVLARLCESEAFPSLESPQIRAKFDMLRRNILANAGNIREALQIEQPTNPAAECLGLIRSIAKSNQLGIDDIRKLLEVNETDYFSVRTLRVLPKEGFE